VSVGVRGLEASTTDFVPESDSENENDDRRDVDDSVGKGLVEETQAYDNDADDAVPCNDTVTADGEFEQVPTNPSSEC